MDPSILYLIFVMGHPVGFNNSSPADIQPCNSTCPNGWSFWDNHCYTYVPTLATWPDFLGICSVILPSAYVAVPNSKPENDFIADLIPNGTWYTWLGCNAVDTSGVWVCHDGSGMEYHEDIRVASSNSYWSK